jgi:hypothetical protein
MSSLPEGSNLFGCVWLPDPKQAAALLQDEGWTVRKAGFAEYEATEEGAEMLIEASEPVLIHGMSVRPEKTTERMAAIFRRAAVRFTFEIYDTDGRLVSEISI